MRYYAVKITRADGTPYRFKSLGGLELTSLLANGNTNPAALNVEIDFPIANFTDPDNNAYMRIWGLGLQDLASSSDLNDLDVRVYGGMAKGLPLANPAQAGLLLTGKIFQAFGNWVGVDQTLDLNFIAGGFDTGSADAVGVFPFVWSANTPLRGAIEQTLMRGVPSLTRQISISDKLVSNHDQTGYYTSLTQFADFIGTLSRSILGGDYTGVQIASDGQVIRVWDTISPPTASGGTVVVSFRDLIGQPTWLDAATISVKLVMRSDIHISSVIELPKSLVTTTQQALQRFRDSSTFTGKYFVTQVHHYGNLRQADAQSWNTTIQAVVMPAT